MRSEERKLYFSSLLTPHSSLSDELLTFFCLGLIPFLAFD